MTLNALHFKIDFDVCLSKYTYKKTRLKTRSIFYNMNL